MYIITCIQNGEDRKLVHDDDIEYDWGTDLFKAVVFNSKEEAISFIEHEPKFVNAKKGVKPFLLNDINPTSVNITHIQEIVYKDVANIRFNRVLEMVE